MATITLTDWDGEGIFEADLPGGRFLHIQHTTGEHAKHGVPQYLVRIGHLGEEPRKKWCNTLDEIPTYLAWKEPRIEASAITGQVSPIA